jgi:ketosteroid isomerase-like protein
MGNAESYRRLISSFNARDVEGVLDLCHPEIEYAAIVGETFHGRDGVRSWLTSFAETVAPAVEVKTVEQHGDLLLAGGTARGTGAASGAELDWDFFHAVLYRDGLLARVVTTRDEADARDAANRLVVEAVYDAWGRGDFSPTQWFGPDIEFVPGDGSAVHHGIDALRREWGDWLRSWQDFRVEMVEVEQSGDRVMVFSRFHGRGRSSGIDVEGMQGASLFTVRDGKVTRLELFLDWRLARRALAGDT